MNEAETANDLRRKLHMMKAKDREEIGIMAAKASPLERFLKSHWFTGIATGLSVFGLLYITNPIFVQEDKEKYAVPKPNLKRVMAWAVLAGLITALAPLVYQKFSSK